MSLEETAWTIDVELGLVREQLRLLLEAAGNVAEDPALDQDIEVEHILIGLYVSVVEYITYMSPFMERTRIS
jgi:hypothetical protein